MSMFEQENQANSDIDFTFTHDESAWVPLPIEWPNEAWETPADWAAEIAPIFAESSFYHETYPVQDWSKRILAHVVPPLYPGAVETNLLHYPTINDALVSLNVSIRFNGGEDIPAALLIGRSFADFIERVDQYQADIASLGRGWARGLFRTVPVGTEVTASQYVLVYGCSYNDVYVEVFAAHPSREVLEMVTPDIETFLSTFKIN